MDKSEVLYNYEELLIGDAKQFKSCFIDASYADRCKGVGYLFRYVVEELLEWTPEQAVLYLDMNIIEAFKLDKCYAILDIKKADPRLLDNRFILSFAFPEFIHYNEKAHVINEYNKVMKLDIYANDAGGDTKMRKKFFSAVNGAERANTLLNHVVKELLSYMTIEEQYDFFADRAAANSWLKKKKLYNANEVLYNDPFEYFHNSLPDNEKDYLLYFSQIFLDICEKNYNENDRD